MRRLLELAASAMAVLLIAPVGLLMAAETGTVTDIDGNVYTTVRIGGQWWTAENLKVTHDPLGNPIASLVYSNDPANEDVYGRLYTWDVTMNGSTLERAQGIAPDGWFIPSDADWQALFAHLGGTNVAGGKMKEAGTAHWHPPNVGATNSSGFAARGAGSHSTGGFEGLGVGTHFWSSTQSGSSASIPTLHTSTASVLLFVVSKTFRHSVRCVRDEPVPIRNTTWGRIKAVYR